MESTTQDNIMESNNMTSSRSDGLEEFDLQCAIEESKADEESKVDSEIHQSQVQERIRVSAGGICPKGAFSQLDCMGMTLTSSLMELTDNAVDSKANKISFKDSGECKDIIMTDNGKGMTLNEFKNALMLYRHIECDQTIGKVGLGLKAASKCLGVTKIITKSASDIYYTLDIDWNHLKEVGLVDDAFEIIESSQSDIELFKTHLAETGTLIKFPRTKDIKDELIAQFWQDYNPNFHKDYKNGERFSFAYGLQHCNIEYIPMAQQSMPLKNLCIRIVR